MFLQYVCIVYNMYVFVTGQLNQCLQLIEKDLNILCRSLTENVEDQIEQDQVIRLLKDLGLRSIQPKDLIHDHIIPIFKNGSWKVVTRFVYINLIWFVCGFGGETM